MLEADTKTTNYLMQRDNKPSTRGSKHASSYLKLAGTSARTRQRRIIDWLGMLRFPHASSNLPPTRCKQTHFHEFQFYMSEAFGQQNNSWVQLGRRHQTEIHYPTGMQTTTFERTMLETPTSYESECRSPRQTGFGGIPMMAFLQVINHSPTPACEFHGDTRDLYKNWPARVIQPGGKRFCAMEEGDNQTDEDFSNMKGEGKGEGK